MPMYILAMSVSVFGMQPLTPVALQMKTFFELISAIQPCGRDV